MWISGIAVTSLTVMLKALSSDLINRFFEFLKKLEGQVFLPVRTVTHTLRIQVVSYAILNI